MSGLPEGTEEYLRGIGMGAPLVDRATKLMADVDGLLAEPMLHVVVDEFRDESGTPIYGGIWLLTQNYAAEIHDFMSNDRFDIVGLKEGIFRLLVQRDHFEFDDPATDQSRLTIEVALSQVGSMGLTGSIRASGKNCEHLWEIVKSYWLPKLS